MRLDSGDLLALSMTVRQILDDAGLSCAGKARRKRSTGKSTWPGRKQVFRRYDGAGLLDGDTITLAPENLPGEPLLEAVMRDGKRIRETQSLAEARDHTRSEIGRLPDSLRALDKSRPDEVEVAGTLRRLVQQVDAEFH